MSIYKARKKYIHSSNSYSTVSLAISSTRVRSFSLKFIVGCVLTPKGNKVFFYGLGLIKRRLPPSIENFPANNDNINTFVDQDCMNFTLTTGGSQGGQRKNKWIKKTQRILLWFTGEVFQIGNYRICRHSGEKVSVSVVYQMLVCNDSSGVSLLMVLLVVYQYNIIIS